MARTLTLIPGKVSNGLVIPDEALPFADGTRVEIGIPLAGEDLQYEVETAAWNSASNDAWAMIDRWEQEEAGETR